MALNLIPRSYGQVIPSRVLQSRALIPVFSCGLPSSLPLLFRRHIHQEGSKARFSIKRDSPGPISAQGQNRPLTVTGNGEGQKQGESRLLAPSQTSNRTLLLVAVAAGIFGYAAARSNIHDSLVKTNDTYGSPEDFKKAIRDLRDTFSEEEDEVEDIVSTNPDVLHAHGFSTLAYHEGMIHDVVVFPRSTEDVVKIVRIATKYRMPITPYSGGTNLEGQTRGHPVGGICVDLSNMNKILAIHEVDSDIVCQPGAGWVEINETLKDKGIPLFVPLDPSPDATIGGMLSTGCSGTNAVRYGTAKAEWFLNATVVLPSGEVIKTRKRSRKSSAGPDMTKLFIGAEGTLGIVTEITMRLAPVMPTTVARANFPNVKKATEAVIEILNQGVGIQCIELLDDVFITALNKLQTDSGKKAKYAVKDHLFFKFQGPSSASLKETASIVKKLVEKHGGENFAFARNDEEAEEMWGDRKNAHFAVLSMIPGAKGWPTDVCVPISKLPQLVYETKKDMESVGLVAPIVGHVGDGNFHAMPLMSNDEDLEKARKAVHRMVRRAIALDGTCTGEHGVGVGKKEYLVEELGEGTVELMRTIKRTIDPLNLFNPGKLYPDPTPKNAPEK